VKEAKEDGVLSADRTETTATGTRKLNFGVGNPEATTRLVFGIVWYSRLAQPRLRERGFAKLHDSEYDDCAWGYGYVYIRFH